MKNLRTGTAKFDTIRAKDANGLSIQDDGGNGLFIKDGGNVGIGTRNPSVKLDVYGDWKFRQAGAVHTFESYLYGAQLNIENITVGGWARANRIKTSDTSGTIFFGALGGDTTLSKAYWTIADPVTSPIGHDVSNGIFLLKNGNVGIGTTNPSAVLEVKADSPKSLILNNNQAGGYLELQSSSNTQGYIQWGMTPSGATSGDDLLLTNTTTNGGVAITKSGVAQLYVNSNGNVGIGTASPDSTLHIMQSGNVDDGITLQQVNHNGKVNLRTNSVGEFIVDVNDATVEAMRILSNGNVGIGTANPSSAVKLHVNGMIYGTTTAIFGNLSASSDVQTNADKELISTSDKRLKNDLGDCEYGLSEILQVQPKKYTWKSGPEDQKSTVGFFAQDVHSIMPEAAPREAIQNENGEDDYRWGFHSQTIIAALVNATKEQQQIIEQLQSQNASLESRISALES